MKPVAACLIALLVTASVRAASDDGGAVKVGLSRSVPGTFYVAGTIGAAGPVDFLLDTGSSVTVINQRILAALEAAGQATYSRSLEGHMADGTSRVVPVYRVARMRLGADCAIADVEAAVFPGATRPILGMNTLARLAPFTFSNDPPHLEFAACGEITAEAAAPQE